MTKQKKVKKKKLKIIEKPKFDLSEVDSNQLIKELRNRGFVVSGRLAGIKY